MTHDGILLDEINERELEIIDFLQQGLSNQEIADRIYLAKSTVKWYVRQLNSKLDTGNRNEIVARANELGLLDQDEITEAPKVKQIPKVNLPRQTTTFVGRDTELDELYKVLENPDARLITILSPGGMGKTRLSLEAAEQQQNNFRDGVFFVPLQAVTRDEGIFNQIATSMGFRFANDNRSIQEQLLEYLSDKQVLLVLDNFEQLLDSAEVLNELLTSAPEIKVIVTSREKLNLLGETIYTLGGMDFPAWESPRDAMRYDSVQLLVQTAKRTKPDWEMTPENLEYVARVCRLTEGMPLGILLATSWLNIYSLEQICDEIQRDIDILSTEMRDVPERQRSIRAIFNYSWNRLSDRERTALMNMSVFRGGCNLNIAQHVADAGARVLLGLVNKALLSFTNGRYVMHELFRQYAEAQLSQISTSQLVYDAHLAYFVDMLRDRQSELHTAQENDFLQMIEENFEDIKFAWQYASIRYAWSALAPMITPVQQYLLVYGHHKEGLQMFEPLVKVIKTWDEPSDRQYPVLIEMIYATKFLTQINIISPRALENIQRKGLEMARAKGDEASVLKCLRALVKLIRHPERLEETEALLEEALELADKLDDQKMRARLLLNQALIEYDFKGNRAASLQLNRETIQLTRKTGDMRRLIKAMSNAAVIAIPDGNWQEIKDSLVEAQEIAQEINDVQTLFFNLGIQRDLALYQMDIEEAKRLQEELAFIENKLNVPWKRYTRNYRNFFWMFLNERYEDGLMLWHETQKLKTDHKPYAMTDIPHGALFSGMLGYIDDYLTGIEHSLRMSIKRHDISRVIYESVPMLVILYDAQEFERCAEFLSMIVNYENTWEMVQQHPYVIALHEELHALLGEAAFQHAWEHGKQGDILATVETLYGELAT